MQKVWRTRVRRGMQSMRTMESMKNKSQASVEYVILLLLFMTAVSIAVFFSVNQIQFDNMLRMDMEAGKVVNEISRKINLVVVEGNGFQANLTLPEKILGNNYSVFIQSNFVVLTVQNKTYFKPLLTSNITGTIKKGMNTLYNSNGMIIIL